MSVKSLKTGTRSISMLAGNTPEHHVLIAETTVGSGGATTVTFSDIPSTYQHLQIRAIGRYTSSIGSLSSRINGDTGNNYYSHRLFGDGATAASDSFGASSIGVVGVLSSSTSTFTGLVIDILDYASTSKNKTVRSLYGLDSNGSGEVGLRSYAWFSTSAITSFSLGNFSSLTIAQFSTFQLYGVK